MSIPAHGIPANTARMRDILAAIDAAFAVERPSWFVNARHCCECAEHEAELQRFGRDDLPLEVVASAAWDPIAFVSHPDGFEYFLPRLARLAYGRGADFYLDQFLANLRPDRVARMSPEQRLVLIDLIYDLADALADDLSDNDWPAIEWCLAALEDAK
jgi:hypothetical protein